MAIQRYCAHCRAVVPLGHKHRAKDKRPSAAARGYDAKWRKTRAAFLACNPQCSAPGCTAPATDVDHIDGLGPRGPRGHDPDNLRALCHSHHSQRTARDQPGGWRKRQAPLPDMVSDPFLVVLGESGVGKSAVAFELEPLLGQTAAGPDEYEDGWTTLLRRLDNGTVGIVECVALHSQLRRRLQKRPALLVQLTASDETRALRLSRRGERARDFTDLLAPSPGYAYGEEDRYPLSLVLDAESRSPRDLALEIAARWEQATPQPGTPLPHHFWVGAEPRTR